MNDEQLRQLAIHLVQARRYLCDARRTPCIDTADFADCLECELFGDAIVYRHSRPDIDHPIPPELEAEINRVCEGVEWTECDHCGAIVAQADFGGGDWICEGCEKEERE